MTNQERLLAYLKNSIKIAQSTRHKHILDKQSFVRQNKRREHTFIEYQQAENSVKRSFTNDRVFPVDAYTLIEYKQKTGMDAGTPFIHLGANADEYAREMNALAITIGLDIYFRNKAYKPETEEGRKTIAHELTHAAQYKNKPLADNRTQNELEHEAEAIEKTEEYSTEKKYELIIDGKTYKMKENQYKQFISELQEKVEQRLQSRSYMMSEQNYLRLLCTYENMLKRKELPWQN